MSCFPKSERVNPDNIKYVFVLLFVITVYLIFLSPGSETQVNPLSYKYLTEIFLKKITKI